MNKQDEEPSIKKYAAALKCFLSNQWLMGYFAQSYPQISCVLLHNFAHPQAGVLTLREKCSFLLHPYEYEDF